METASKEDPFRYMLLADLFSKRSVEEILHRMESVSWTCRDESFFRIQIPETEVFKDDLLDLIAVDTNMRAIKSELEAGLGCQLHENYHVEAHRYMPGCAIGPHTDAEDEEIRLVVNLNRQWHAHNGGIWVLAADSQLSDRRIMVPNICNTGFAFHTGRSTFHALSHVSNGVLYSVILKFYPKT